MSKDLDAERVPSFVAPLLPLAAAWGIGDDFERAKALDSATMVELLELSRCLDDVDADAVFDWLAGPESFSSDPSAEYLAITNLTMAIDLATLRLKSSPRRQGE